MKVAYFDCFSGASGDMILGALIDAGLSIDALRVELAKLGLTGYHLMTKIDRRGAIAGTRLTVKLDRSAATQGHRQLSDILAIIENSELSPDVKQRAGSVFCRLAEAEAKVHGIPVPEVHFHEVGAVDAIVDIVGSAVGFELLGVSRIFCSALPSGGGTARSAHGTLPVPAPATLELIALAGAPIKPSPSAEAAEVELVTPTGAAILTTLATFRFPTMRVHGVGYGLGTRELSTLPNALRLWLGDTDEHAGKGNLVLLETNIDDMTPELLGYVLDRLLSTGARDAWFTPIQMKKNRPATMLSVLVEAVLESDIAQIILRETTTLGIRSIPIQRHEAEREVFRFRSSLGDAVVKVKRIGDAIAGLAPEYEVCKQLAQAHGLALQEVYRRVEADAREALQSQRTA